jgi:TolB protein
MVGAPGGGEMRFFVLAVAVVVTATLAPPAHGTFPGENGDIAYASSSKRRPGIYRLAPDGAQRVRLSKRHDFWPAWSPGGSKIAFSRLVGEGFVPTVFVMRADGSNKRRVSGKARGLLHGHVWSPTGRRLAYADDLVAAEPRVGAIKVVRPNGTGEKRLTGYGSLNVHPAWSPDGNRIAFVSDRDGDGEIWVMNKDGSNKTKLSDNDVLDELPDWSSDGSRIVFETTVPGPPGQGDTGSSITVIDADGTHMTTLTDGSRLDTNPSWSPAEDQILFVGWDLSGEEIVGDLYVMNADGTDLTNLTLDFPGFVEDAAWSPEGNRIVFIADGDVFVIGADATGLVNLTGSRARESGADWQSV